LAQIFSTSANRAPVAIALAVAALAVAAGLGAWWFFSPEYTDVGYQPDQPVAFSHQLHAGELRLDCRYCHYTVERSPVAAVPATSVCMNCHTLVGRDLETLAPVRDSASSGTRLRWVRVHDLPDYARFDHSLHLAAGIGCSSCHGDVRAMAEVTQVEPLSMGWCLECHRDPAPHRRPAAELTDTAWTPPADQAQIAARLAADHPVAPPTACTGCHQ
jgi:hypothetical protein